MVPEVVLPPEDKQPQFKEMVDHGAIGVFDNFLKWEFCDSVIDAFEYWHHKKYILAPSQWLVPPPHAFAARQIIDMAFFYLSNTQAKHPPRCLNLFPRNLVCSRITPTSFAVSVFGFERFCCEERPDDSCGADKIYGGHIA